MKDLPLGPLRTMLVGAARLLTYTLEEREAYLDGRKDYGNGVVNMPLESCQRAAYMSGQADQALYVVESKR